MNEKGQINRKFPVVLHGPAISGAINEKERGGKVIFQDPICAVDREAEIKITYEWRIAA